MDYRIVFSLLKAKIRSLSVWPCQLPNALVLLELFLHPYSISLSYLHLSGIVSHLVLIDGHHLMYRAYWAIPRTLKTKAGEQSNAVFGMASMLLSILKQEEPDKLLLCFDAGEETFRHQENETYKEGRVETPDDFYAQIPRIMQLVDAFGFAHISEGKYEADDFICAFAKIGKEEGMRVTIVSGDRDLFQLIDDKVRVAIPHKGYQQAEYLGPQEVIAKYGIRPDQVAAWKGLAGDSSDNLPGVMGIGPKTAATLLQDYDSLEGIYAHLEDIRPAVREKLEKDRDQAFFCERMAQLVCDMPLSLQLQDLSLTDLPTDTLVSFFQEMDFTLLLKRFQEVLKTSYGARIFQRSEIAIEAEPVPKAESQLSLFS